MKTFALKITSPEGDLFSGEAVKLSLRGTEGEFAIMAGHVPFATAIVPCKCKIELENGEEKSAQTDGGLITVTSEKVLFLSGNFAWD